MNVNMLLLKGGSIINTVGEKDNTKLRVGIVICMFVLLALIVSMLFDDLKREDCIGREKVYAAYKSFLKLVLRYAVAGLLIVIIFAKILIHGYVPTESMVPTLDVGEHLIINGTAYWFSEPERGDIVVFDSDELNETLVKRCIGLPGDHISFKDGDVYINGEKLDESAYLDPRISSYSMKEFDVPEGEYFFMGDNRIVSNDARYWKDSYIPKKNIVGKVIYHFSFRDTHSEPVILGGKK